MPTRTEQHTPPTAKTPSPSPSSLELDASPPCLVRLACFARLACLAANVRSRTLNATEAGRPGKRFPGHLASPVRRRRTSPSGGAPVAEPGAARIVEKNAVLPFGFALGFEGELVHGLL